MKSWCFLLALSILAINLNAQSPHSSSSNELYNLTIELEDVEHIYGKVGDYVNHWYQIGDELYSSLDKVNMQVKLNDRINLKSTSCDCNEKHVDRADEEMMIQVGKLNPGINGLHAVLKVTENRGKFAGQSAVYHFHYKITLTPKML